MEKPRIYDRPETVVFKVAKCFYCDKTVKGNTRSSVERNINEHMKYHHKDKPQIDWGN